jgi:hypothetical protein
VAGLYGRTEVWGTRWLIVIAKRSRHLLLLGFLPEDKAVLLRESCQIFRSSGMKSEGVMANVNFL